MVRRRTLEQHIAVFGESGSGKTVLLSSFFGSMRKPGQSAKRRFALVADKPAQGTQLLKKYYDMRDNAKAPAPNKYRADAYKFSLKVKSAQGSAAHFDAVRMVWHDYPGEWFEQDVSGETEARRRVDLFRSLLRSDVALLLVDGQQLLDHAGSEERYFGKLFGSLSNCLLAMKDDLLEDGQPLVQFPRIWMLGLSKADLLPEMTASAFEELVIRDGGHHLNELREVIQSMVAGDQALAVGEDLLLLSSAKFTPGQIDVNERVGVDLILPLAAVLPFERHLRWAKSKELPARVARELLSSSTTILAVLGWASGVLKNLKLPGPLGAVAVGVSALLASRAANEIIDMADKRLEEALENAVQKHDDLGAILTQFRIDLEEAEESGVLVRSKN
ncbi:TRAFAC clade GTPase domain-containing protein [uncultured Brachybacterium sp.]|uniref:TRAFAC clade GTPase domain-containing protein n=1 Tax=uncultured Brachybacterium sp. TaxID=189680 RepID=UPI002623D498|nr:ATP/GTP-binding protein [uncultured Brachybacterium sp.]